MRLFKHVFLCLLLTLSLTGCTVRKSPPAATAETTRPTTTTAVTVPSAEGEWTARLSAADLLQLAKDAPSALAVLGEDNVQKLTLAATLLGGLETEATLTVALSLQPGGVAEWTLPRSGMQQATDTILKEYNPLLAALLSPQITGYLPPDITIPATYTQAGRQITLTVSGGELSLSLQGDGLTVDGLTADSLSETENALLGDTLRRLLFLRNGNE